MERDEFWRELEEAGEDEVRVRVATGAYGNASHRRALAVEWLSKKNYERGVKSVSESRTINLEQLRITRSAKNAAWAAAIAAIIAAICAALAIWVSSIKP